MHLKHLSIINFKNWEQLELDLKKGIICFTGANGEGKTNIIDALHVLSFCKSFLNPVDSQNIRHGESFYMVNGVYEVEGEELNVVSSFKKGQKKVIKKNNKAYERIADHIGEIPCVIIAPQDVEIVLGGSEVRRKLFDALISQYDKQYLNELIKYSKLVSQRNAMLKHMAKSGNRDCASVQIYDDQMIEPGEYIHKQRTSFIEEFKPVFAKIHKELCEGNDDVSLSYKSDLSTSSFKESLDSAFEKDRIVQYTTVGIHKDDYVFTIDGFPLKKFGSQGQQKTFTIALKLAQIGYLKSKVGKTPLLLLDDIFDKLDEKRIASLLRIVANENIEQAFVTDTSTSRLEDILQSVETAYNVIEIADGKAQ